jgi:hypothetical protein
LIAVFGGLIHERVEVALVLRSLLRVAARVVNLRSASICGAAALWGSRKLWVMGKAPSIEARKLGQT